LRKLDVVHRGSCRRLAWTRRLPTLAVILFFFVRALPHARVSVDLDALLGDEVQELAYLEQLFHQGVGELTAQRHFQVGHSQDVLHHSRDVGLL